MSARWSVAWVLTAAGFRRWTRRVAVHCCIISRVALHSLTLRSSAQSFKHLFFYHVSSVRIYLFIAVFLRSISRFCAGETTCHQLVESGASLLQCFFPAVFGHDKTDSILLLFLPTTMFKPNAFLLYHSQSWAFCYQTSCCCSFVLLPQCKSAEAALGFISRKDSPFSTQTVYSYFHHFSYLIICAHVAPALCQSAYSLLSLPSVLHLAVSSQPCWPLSSVWTLFLPSCFSCVDSVQF